MNRDEKAKAVHDIWAHWMKYVLEMKASPTGPNGTLTLSNSDVKRWKRQMNTEFEDLTDEEKISDYKLAKLYLTKPEEDSQNRH
tara:strand:- start:36 stop:287 length:252 start_codon:yes stop_codon:yes gene_type:complete